VFLLSSSYFLLVFSSTIPCLLTFCGGSSSRRRRNGRSGPVLTYIAHAFGMLTTNHIRNVGRIGKADTRSSLTQHNGMKRMASQGLSYHE